MYLHTVHIASNSIRPTAPPAATAAIVSVVQTREGGRQGEREMCSKD